MGLKDLWNDIEDGLGDAKDWIEDNVDDVDDWIEDTLEGTPLDGAWEKARDAVADRAWGYVEETVGEGRADLAADLYHGRTDDAVATLGGYAEDAVEGTWVEDYVEGAGKVVDAIQDGPEAVAKLGGDHLGEQLEGTWAEGLWGAVGKPATGLVGGLAGTVGDELEDTWVEDGFGAIAHVADLAGRPDEDAPAATAEPASTDATEPSAPTPSGVGAAGTGNGIVNEMVLRPAVEPQDGGFLAVERPEPIDVAVAPAPGATPIPDVAAAPAPAPAAAEVPTVEVAPAPEPTAFETTVAAADQAESSIDDMFSDLG